MGELRIDPKRLRQIGSFDVPDEAERLATVAQDLFDALGSFNSMTALAGDPTALRNLLKVGGDVYDEIRETVEDLNNIGVALVMTADDFHGTDQQAEQQYQGLTPAPLPPSYDGFEDKGANDEEGGHVDSTPNAVDPDEYGGGPVSGGFDRGAFDDALDSIETYLGYLKGNDLMWDYFNDYQLSTIGEVPWPVEFNYTSPCPEGRFAVRFDHYLTIDVIIGEGESDLQQQRLQEVKDNLDKAWWYGPAWAGGVAVQARNVCDQFTEPYVPTFVGALDLMQARVVNRLQVSANDDWLKLGGAAATWEGEFADNFRIFYDNYNDVIARFGLFTSWVNLGFALGTKIIAGVQLGAGKFVDSLEKNLESQLDHWADSGGDKPTDPSSYPAWVGDTVKLVDDTISLASGIPVVGEVAGVIGMGKKALTVIEDINTLAGGGLLGEKKTYAEVMTGSEAFDLFINTLHDDHYLVYRDGMQRLNQGGEGDNPLERSMSGKDILAMMQEVKGLGDWGLPDVPASNLR